MQRLRFRSGKHPFFTNDAGNICARDAGTACTVNAGNNGAAAAPAEFPASQVVYGGDITSAYERLGGDFSRQYDVYSIARRILEIKDDTGWEPFIQTFHYMQENEADYAGAMKLQKLENFVSLVSGYSGIDIRTYFTADEWNTIISKIGN